MIRCEQGCDISTLLADFQQFTQFSFTVDSCERKQHCGIKDTSPLCIDTEYSVFSQSFSLIPRDIDSIEYVHQGIAPWFMINNITMLRHMSVAYFNEMSTLIPYYWLIGCFNDLKKNGSVQINSDSNIEFFERWVEEGRVAMKPANSLQVLVITPPRKTAKPIKQGRKFKAEIQPAMLSGVARVCKSNENECTLMFRHFTARHLKSRKVRYSYGRILA